MADAAQVNKGRNRQVGRKVLFPWGLPGLEYYREFILNSLGQDSHFCFLQAVKQQEIGLLLVNPYVFFDNYEFDLSEEIAAQLKIDDEYHVAVLCTVNTSRGIGAVTVNLLAPIIINTEQWLAKQVVLNNRKYSLRTPIKIGVKKEER